MSSAEAAPRFTAAHGFALAAGAALLLLTVYPSVFASDSSEFSITAATFGIGHAPGYPLYTLLAGLFARLLPLGDFAFRVNLFSAICAALTLPVLADALRRLTHARWASVAVALSFGLLFLNWYFGTVAEVYPLQNLTLAGTLWGVARLCESATRRRALTAGILYGLAVAAHPASGLMAAGVAAAFIRAGVRWRWSVMAAALAVFVFALSLLYFPLRQAANPAFSMAGVYGADGAFVAVRLDTLDGLRWMVSGQQFGVYFFSGAGLTPLLTIQTWLNALWREWLGIGAALGTVGVVVLATRRWAWSWALAIVPYAMFFATYGADDREAMLGPTWLLWAVAVGAALAVGEHWLARHGWRRFLPLMLALPMIFAAVNLPPILTRNREMDVRGNAQAALDALPLDAEVFGLWTEMPMQYLQTVEGQRPDVTFRNLILFAPGALTAYLNGLLASESPPPVIFLERRVPLDLDPTTFRLLPFYISEADRQAGRASGFMFEPLE